MGILFTQILATIFIVGLIYPSLSVGKIPKEDGTDRFGRPYRIFTLENGMNVVILQDENATIAASSLRIAAGAMNDPPEIQGLAHFLEHLVFLGNKKFPEPEAISKFAGANGGHSNAGTSSDTLEYEFSINADHLDGGLEHLEGVVFHPTFSEDAINKEVHAVDSEYEKGIPSSRRKEYWLLKKTSKPGHPFAQFNTGSRNYLLTTPMSQGINVTQKLYEFHQTHYFPAKMSLAVIGKEGLDEIHKMVEKHFGNAKNPNDTNNYDKVEWEDAWGKEELGTKIEMAVPPGTDDSLTLYFPIPKEFEIPYDEYYAPMFTYKCRDCLYGYLDKKGWITYIGSSVTKYYRYFYVGGVEVTLTKLGFEHRDEVVTAVYQYIELLRNKGPQKWFWDEHHMVHYISDLSESKSRPDYQAGYLSNALLATNSTKEVLKNLYRKPKEVDFPKEEIQEMLSYLVPRNMRMMVISQGFNNKTTKYDELYKVHYNYERINGSLLENISNVTLNTELNLPEPMDGLPNTFDLPNITGGETGEPVVIMTTNYTQLWYKENTKFNVPATSVRGTIFSPYSSTSVWDKVLGSLMHRAFKQCRNQFPSYLTYIDSLLGNSVSTGWDNGKVTVTINALTPSIPTVLQKLAGVLTNCSLEEKDFKTIKQQFRNSIIGGEQWQACNVVDKKLVLRGKHFTTDEQVEALEGVTLEDLQEFTKRMFSQIRIHWLMHGNIDEAAAKKSVQEFENRLTSAYKSKPLKEKAVTMVNREIQFPQGTRGELELESRATNSNSTCTQVLYQSETHRLKDAVMLKVVDRLLDHPLYTELRSNQGLGYVASVGAYGGSSGSSRYLQIKIQGAYEPPYVQEKIDNFFENFMNETLKKLNETEFAAVISSQKAKWLQPEISLENEADRLWNGINYRDERARKEKVEILESLKIQDVIDYYEKLTSKCTKRSVAFHVFAPGHKPVSEEKCVPDQEYVAMGNNTSICGFKKALSVSSVEEWKQQRQLLPLYN